MSCSTSVQTESAYASLYRRLGNLRRGRSCTAPERSSFADGVIRPPGSGCPSDAADMAASLGAADGGTIIVLVQPVNGATGRSACASRNRAQIADPSDSGP